MCVERRSWLRAPLVAALLVATACASQSDVERQREANVAAAERETPPSATPSLRRTGDLTKADRAAWRKLLQWPEGCESAFEATARTDDGGVTLHTAGAGVTLVQVRCASGSYQSTQAFVRLDERGSSPMATVLQFPVLQSEDGRRVEETTDTELAGEVVVSPDGRTLSVLAVARQLRDCGVWTRYSITGEHPRVLAAAVKLPCPATPGDPAEWTDGNSPSGWRPLPAAR